jgi:hypothetical protein
MSHSLSPVSDGKGVGPMGSVHFSPTILPIENSRFFTDPMSVLSSPIFTVRSFLLNYKHSLRDLEAEVQRKFDLLSFLDFFSMVHGS